MLNIEKSKKMNDSAQVQNCTLSSASFEAEHCSDEVAHSEARVYLGMVVQFIVNQEATVLH